jgi:uncharacterized protein YeaO (DUF488 family)
LIRVKRAYEAPDEGDGLRVLVDRLWPRGLNKERSRLDFWAKELAPTEDLRKWFGHDPQRWREFKRRYFKELRQKKAWIDTFLECAKGKTITLVYAAKADKFNNALALKEYLEKESSK